MPKKVSLKIKVFATFLIIALCFIVGEIYVRSLGHKPFTQKYSTSPKKEYFAFDPIIGWVPKPGVYQYPSPDSKLGLITTTILPDKSRKSQPNPDKNQESEIWFLGGSYTQGEGVSDKDTFIWKLQEQHPEYHFKNFGVGGHGTVQSYLFLKKLLENSAPPKEVLYGFLTHHEVRNSANLLWLKMTTEVSAKNKKVLLPYCLPKQNGTFDCNHIAQYPRMFGDTTSALLNFLKEHIYRIQHRQINQSARQITQETIRKMHTLCQEKNIKFTVFFYDLFEQEDLLNYEEYLKSHHIPFINIAHSYLYNQKFTVRNDGHPNPKLHDIYKEKFEKFYFVDE